MPTIARTVHTGIVISGNDILKFGNSAAARYAYSATGNTIKDMVSGQDTITWNLYNKVTRTRNDAGSNAMYFNYDGAGQRVWKAFSTNPAPTHGLERGEYYVRDGSGNILAVYNTVTDYWGINSWRQANPTDYVHSQTTAYQYASFAYRLYSRDGAFNGAIENYVSLGSARVLAPVSYYTASNGDLVRQMAAVNTSYVDSLMAWGAGTVFFKVVSNGNKAGNLTISQAYGWKQVLQPQTVVVKVCNDVKDGYPLPASVFTS